MEAQSLLKLGRGGNILLIIANAAMFFFFTIERSVVKGWTYADLANYQKVQNLITLENTVRIVVGVAALIALALCIVGMVKNEGKLKGWGLLLPAAIVTGVFAILGLMLGIVIWILCGISLSMLNRSYNEYTSMQNFGPAGDPANNFGGVPLNQGYDQGFNGGYNQQGGYTDPFNNQNNPNNGF